MLKYVYMLKYSKYLYKNIVSRKTFWITLFFTLLVIAILGILEVLKANKGGYNPLYRISENDKIIPFILSSLMTALVVVFIFKSGEKDGSDLLVAAKPISRLKMIFGKFIILISFIVFIQLLVFLVTFSYVQVEIYSNMKHMFKFAFALSTGGIIIQLIVASLATFSSLFVSRVGLFMITLLGASTIPIISGIIGTISHNGPDGVRGINDNGVLIRNGYYQPLVKRVEKIYSDLEKEDVANGGSGFSTITDERWEKANKDSDAFRGSWTGKTRIRLPFKKDIISSEKYLKERWYDKVAPFDMWYHWSSFYDQVLYDELQTNQEWNPVKRVIDYDAKYSMNPITKDNPKGDIFSKIFLVTKIGTINYPSATLKNIEVMFQKAKTGKIKGTNMTYAQLFHDQNKSFYERMNLFMSISQQQHRTQIDYLTHMIYTKLTNYFKTQTGTNQYKPPLRIFPAPKPNENDDDNGRFLRTDSTKQLSKYNQSWLYVKGDRVEVWEPTPHIKQSTRVWIWASFVIGMFGLVVFIYYRKDFK